MCGLLPRPQAADDVVVARAHERGQAAAGLIDPQRPSHWRSITAL